MNHITQEKARELDDSIDYEIEKNNAFIHALWDAAIEWHIAQQAAPKYRDDISLELLERLSKTLTKLGYATPEGGMEHFNAYLPTQLYNLCRGVDSILAAGAAPTKCRTGGTP